MTSDLKKIELLKQDLDLMLRAAKVLEKSWKECQKCADRLSYPLEELDRLELLSSRFSRLTDFMVQRIFRLIDEIDLEQPGTARDIINRAAKKGMINDPDSFIEARILRNKIAHEYVEKVMTEIYQKAVDLVPALLDSVKRVEIYTKKYEK